jgi:hypothetical protein
LEPSRMRGVASVHEIAPRSYLINVKGCVISVE